MPIESKYTQSAFLIDQWAYDSEKEEDYQDGKQLSQLIFAKRPQVQKQEETQITKKQQVIKPAVAAEKEKSVAFEILAPARKMESPKKMLEEITELNVASDSKDLPSMQTYYHKNNGGTGAFAREGVLNQH